MVRKKTVGVLVGAISLAIGSSAHAAGISFDTHGDGVINDVAAFDWAPSNVLSLGGSTAFAAFANTGGGACTTGVAGDPCSFDVHVQGRLSAFKDSSNAVINTPNLDSTYEYTYVIGFSERVTTAVPITATDLLAVFAYNPGVLKDAVTPNFFRVYQSAADSSDLAGTGFDNGTLIFESGIEPDTASGSFTSSFQNSSAITPDIGGAGSSTPAAWAGTTTVSGTGATSPLDLLATAPTVLDGTYFLNDIASFIISSISQQLAYTTVDPALSFANAPGYVANVGGVNGGLSLFEAGGAGSCAAGFAPPACIFVPTDAGAAGESIIFQTDPNGPITRANAPVPTSLALLGAGLLGIGRLRRRASKLA